MQGSPPTVTARRRKECKEQCMSQTTFICAAVNYKESDGTCELLAENNQTASVAEPRDDNWRHYIRPICAGTENMNIFVRHYFSPTFILKLAVFFQPLFSLTSISKTKLL